MKSLKRFWPLLILGGLIPGVILLGPYLNLSSTLITVLVVIITLLLFSSALWINANRNADGTEWWQDDDASGWRGY